MSKLMAWFVGCAAILIGVSAAHSQVVVDMPPPPAPEASDETANGTSETSTYVTADGEPVDVGDVAMYRYSSTRFVPSGSAYGYDYGYRSYYPRYRYPRYGYGSYYYFGGLGPFLAPPTRFQLVQPSLPPKFFFKKFGHKK